MKFAADMVERVGFGALILGGYVLAMGTLAFIPIPVDNVQLFGQALGTLSTAVGIICAAIWRTSRDDASKTQALADQASALASAAPAAAAAALAGGGGASGTMTAEGELTLTPKADHETHAPTDGPSA